MSEKKATSLLEWSGDEQVALSRDHFERGDFSILTDGYRVWLGEQKLGEPPTQKIEIPKSTFDALIRNYITPQEAA